VRDQLASGSLKTVLTDWTPPFPGLRLYYPPHRHMTAGLRAFVDLLREERKSVIAARPIMPSGTMTSLAKPSRRRANA
jgi:DNA-binding transcriptional LysR family regulator